MKKFFFILCCLMLCFAFKGFCQNNHDLASDDTVYGDPYLLKDWSKGVIRFTSGRVIDEFKLKFDCVRNLLMLQFKGSAFGAESKVNEFVIYPKGGKQDSMHFKKGFPVSETGTAETFYQILTAGKTTLLKHYYKAVVEEKKLVGANEFKRYEDREVYYLLSNDAMSKVYDENGVDLSRLPPSYDGLKQLAGNARIKNPADLIALTKQFNK